MVPCTLPTTVQLSKTNSGYVTLETGLQTRIFRPSLTSATFLFPTFLQETLNNNIISLHELSDNTQPLPQTTQLASSVYCEEVV